MANWMIYGATGYTGQLIAEEAVRRGHRPILAGRSESKLQPLAQKLGLEYRAFNVEDALRHLQEAGVGLVLHCAGPFVHTAAPMLQACLKTGIHYLDITGEISVFENTFRHDEQAKAKNIVVMSGVGFDIVPSDCLIRYVAGKLPDATWLEVALYAQSLGSTDSTASAGTLQSGLDMIAKGNLVRRGGQLIPYDLGRGAKTFRFPGKERLALPFPWGDLSTAYRTTGIPNITTYLSLSRNLIQTLGYVGPVFSRLMRFKPLRDWLSNQIDRRIIGPSEETRSTSRAHIYARVMNDHGQSAEGWLETIEAYQFTVFAAIRIVERVLAGNLAGALTPANAFGADFVLEIEGTKRHDLLMPEQIQN